MNAARGEVEVVLGGERRTLCLTLGALAAMEAGLGVSGFAALAERLRTMSAGDLAVVLGALLPGEDVGRFGPGEAVSAVTAVFVAAAA